MATLNFDLSGVEASTGFELIPDGTLANIMVTESEIKPVASNPNYFYLALTVEVLDGQFKSRKLWPTLNLWNSEAASAIAKSELKAILLAAQLPINTQDSALIHNRPMTVKIGISKGGVKKDSPTGERYPDKNSIKSWGIYGGAAGAQAASPFAGIPASAPVIPVAPPVVQPPMGFAAPVAPMAPAFVPPVAVVQTAQQAVDVNFAHTVPAAPAFVQPAPVAPAAVAAPAQPFTNPLAGQPMPQWVAPAAQG